MKRTISIGVLCACLAPIAPAQQQPVLPHWGRHLGALPAIASQDAAASLQLSSPQAVKIFDLGHYPGGTWAEPRDINDFGLVVAFGDVPPDGYTHPIAAPIFGLAAGKWFDLGTLGGERYDEVMCMGVADTGLIVGHAALQDDVTIHAFAWTPATGMVDIGVLTDQGFNFSLAYEVNRSGSLIVGFSGSGWYSSDTLPVVWTRNLVWASGRPALQWTISKLDTRGFDGSTGWYATSVNNAGQIIGMAVGPPPITSSKPSSGIPCPPADGRSSSCPSCSASPLQTAKFAHIACAGSLLHRTGTQKQSPLEKSMAKAVEKGCCHTETRT